MLLVTPSSSYSYLVSYELVEEYAYYSSTTTY